MASWRRARADVDRLRLERFVRRIVSLVDSGGAMVCDECDGLGEWVDEAQARCPECEGLGYDLDWLIGQGIVHSASEAQP